VTRASLAAVLVAALLSALPAAAAGAAATTPEDELTAQDEKARDKKARDEERDRKNLSAAQDPGGQQYTDPLDKENPDTPTPGTPPTTPTAPAATASGTGATTDGASAETVAAGKGGSKPGIPRTGFPALLLLGAGSLTIGAGLALRAAVRPGS
jgi:hypothetical protein